MGARGGGGKKGVGGANENEFKSISGAHSS